MNLTEISHTRVSPQSFQNTIWNSKAVSPLPLPDRHSDSTQLRQEKPGTASGQARRHRFFFFFFLLHWHYNQGS